MLRIATILLSLAPGAAFGQEIYRNDRIEGYWTGAFIRGGNSAQIVEVEFRREDDELTASTHIPDWTYYDPMTSVVSVKDRIVEFDTYYGRAKLVFDREYNEMAGTARADAPTWNLHLKKTLKPPRPAVVEQDMTFDVGDAKLSGRLVAPRGDGPFPCAILVHGRGCSTKDWQLGRARALARYGLAVVCFDKRGSEGTAIDCTTTTLAQHSSDVARIAARLRTESLIDPTRVGLIGYSAGGWVAPRAAALDGEIAFLVTVVGPSTSVKEQQLDGARAVTAASETTSKGREQVLRYTELMFATEDYDAVFAEMSELLSQAEKEKWRMWLEDTDIPASAADIPKLWVNRFRNYDPREDLANFAGPFLSILGEKDDIVPHSQQVSRLREVFSGTQKKDYRVVLIPGTGHGMEHGHTVRALGYDRNLEGWPFYYKFDRVAYGAIAEVVDFLRDYELIPK